MAAALSIDVEVAAHSIDRCHRGGNKDWYRRNNKIRPVFVAMKDWETCEELVRASRTFRDCSFEYKYDPITTKRRNMAMLKRRELLNSGDITQGHVKFPARLMGKKPGETVFCLIEDFSYRTVEIKPFHKKD